MSDMIGDVLEFSKKFETAISETPGFPGEDLISFRTKFLQEEMQEFLSAQETGNLAGVADALVDLIYVAIGTAFAYGIPLDRCWDEVHRLNMKKIKTLSAEDSKRKSRFDVIKPAGWEPPDIQAILDDPNPEEEFKWELRYFRLAKHIARMWSKDPRTKVGAVLVGANRNNIAIGYNGFPPGIPDDPKMLNDRSAKHKLMQHAERNVLDNATFDTDGSTIAVTMFPCSECVKSMISKGVVKIICPPPVNYDPWALDAAWAKSMIHQSSTSLLYVDNHKIKRVSRGQS